jgi:hypothetical protein
MSKHMALAKFLSPPRIADSTGRSIAHSFPGFPAIRSCISDRRLARIRGARVRLLLFAKQYSLAQ